MKLAVRMKKIQYPTCFISHIVIMSGIHHVTAASVPEGKSRTSVLKSSFTLSGGIVQQQLPGSTTASSLTSPPIYPI